MQHRIRKPEPDVPVVDVRGTPAHLAPLSAHSVIFLQAEHERTLMPR
jgi:hypothetical protein